MYNKQGAHVPTVMILYGFRFFFYSREETRMHIHVEFQGRKAKVWLDNFEIAANRGFEQYQLNEI